MNSPRLAYSPRLDATPEGELDVLASVYRYILDCGEARRAQEKKNAAGVPNSNGDDAMKGSKNDRANPRIPRG